jgi:deoxyribodipyrimidine photolyase-related protein
LHYTRLDAPDNAGCLGLQLQADIEGLRPARLVMTAPGDWRVLQMIKAAVEASGLPLEIREDRHFFVSVREFAAHAKGPKSLRMEYFYREQRKRNGVLMEGDQTIGGQWNFDADSRESFGTTGPGVVPPRSVFEDDAVTREVIALVNTGWRTSPGPSRGLRRYSPCRLSSRNACRSLAATRTRCGRATPGSITHTSRRRST